jgi:hypothetical protein
MPTPLAASRCLSCALLVFACDPGGSGGSAATGGSPNATGGVTARGGSASGGTAASGGSVASTGGSVSAAGGTSGNGGVPSPSGGSAGGPGSGGAGTSGSAGSPAGGASPTGGAAGNAAAGSGGGGAGTPSGDACGEALFCDDFETATAGQAPAGVWSTRTSAGSVSVDESKFRSGSKSIKFTTEAKDGVKTAFLTLKSDSVFPVAGNHFFGRMMAWLDAAPTESVHWTLLQATGTVPGQSYRAQYRYGGQHPVMENGMFKGSRWMANYETPDSYAGNGPSTDCYHHSTQTLIPTGKWTCVEWEFDGPNATMRLWVDGTAIEDLTVVGKGQGCVGQDASYTWTAPDFSELELGWESYQNDAARTLYVDDVMVSTKPIGCPE